MVRGIQESRQPLKEIRLGPILEEHTHEMVSYILDAPLEQTQSLAQFIAKLTEGNPLFVSESLSFLYNENLLYFKEASNEFSWNMDKIRESNMPSTVVALFSSKVKKLPAKTIDLLEYCACMGNLFTPEEVAQVREITLLDTFEILKPALGQGLLIENKDQLQFVHDKVQEAALSSIDRERRKKIHWEIGNHLYAAIPKGANLEQLENLFTITSHLNIAIRLLEESGQKLDQEMATMMSHLNYCAGNSAMNSLATEAANDYFTRSRELLPLDAWQKDYEGTFRIYQKLAKTELMVGKYESSEKLLDQLLESAKSDLDKAEALAEQTTSLSSIGNFIKAIETANRGLAFIGKDIPAAPDEAKKRCATLMEEIHKDGADVWQTILSMPFTKERKSKIELSFYSELIPDLYMSGLVSQLYLSAAQSTQHCLSGGMDESVIYSFSIMGLNLGENEHFQEAFNYEDLAKQLSEKYPNTFGATRGMNGVVWCNMHSRSHPEEIVAYCLKGIQSGRNCGDLYNAGLCYGPLMWNLQVRGASLSEVEGYAKECLHFSQKFHLSFSVGLAEAVQYGWVDPMKNGGEFRPMDDLIKKWETANHIASIGSYYVHEALVYFYLGDHDEAQKSLLTVEKYMHGLTDNVLKREWYVFRAVNACRLFAAGKLFNGPEEFEKFLNPFIQKLETWANLGPLLKPYLSFLQAEKIRATEGLSASVVAYQEAITVANEKEYHFLEGYLNETLGSVLLQLNRAVVAKLHFREAYRIYQFTQMSRMAATLLEKRPEFLEDEVRVPNVTVDSVDLVQSALALPSLDIEYFLKYSHAIAAEMDTELLLKKIMNIVIELSGAQYGCLIMDDGGELWVNAESQIKEKDAVLTNRIPLSEADHVCRSMVRYVQRTRETIILRNASEEGAFKDNQEVQNLHLKSVFCLPFSKQNKLIGILYIENRLSDSVFSPKQVEMIRLLSTQAAISIENARLVEEMKRAERQITASLREKEVLLKEIHHRVKNNLQVISSLFNLQSRLVKDAEALKALRESQNRVKSMAFVHEKLHQSKDLARIDVGGYLKLLAANLAQSFGGDLRRQQIDMDVLCGDINLSVDFAIPMGLIVNEIVSNCYKHAFPDGRKGRIEIALRKVNGDLELSIRDNGIGFPEDLDFRQTQSLGLQLIMSLMDQVQGEITLIRDGGTQFKIRIPIASAIEAA
jgi:two-component sensor histidine kinase/tetratricopeptide (TPR) repeat protein